MSTTKEAMEIIDNTLDVFLTKYPVSYYTHESYENLDFWMSKNVKTQNFWGKLMFWKKKNNTNVDLLEKQVKENTQKLKELTCSHSHKTYGVFSGSSFFFGIYFKCSDCGVIERTLWNNLSMKKQKAFKTIKIVPNNWKTKTK